mmetsp:Transcript_115347/g.326833  ORF Transcript_115347/g.326833 Transcript_115347/m.326833 type:complete len:1234 (+) Transcript_115347:1948-5649(+)
MLRRGPLQGGEAVLQAQHLVHVLVVDALEVQLEARGAVLADLVRVVAVEGPVAAAHRLNLLQHHGLVPVAVPPVHAGGVGHDDRRPPVGLRLLEGLDGLVHVRREAHRRHVGVLVHHRDLAEVLLDGPLAAGRHLHDRALGRRLGHLGPGVAVALGVEHEDVDVLAGGQHVVEAAEADVVGPAVAPDDPVGRRHEHVGAPPDLLDQLRDVRALLGLEGLQDLAPDLAALGGVVDALEPLAQGRDQLGGRQGLRLVLLHEVLDVPDELLAALLGAEGHAQAVLRGVLEEGARPGRPLPLLVLPEGAHAEGAAPDGRAAAAVGDDHAVAEHLGEELHVGRLAAAGAGAAEDHERVLELRALDAVLVHELVLDAQVVQGELPVLVELVLGELLGLHLQAVVRAHLHAHGAAGAVVGRQLDRVVQPAQLAALGLPGQVALRRGLQLLLAEEEGPHDGVGADDGAEVALGAAVGNPDGDLLREGALLELRLADGLLAAGAEGAHRQAVRGAAVDASEEDLAELVERLAVLRVGGVELPRAVLRVHGVAPGVRVLDAVQVVHRGGQRGLVRRDDLRVLLPVEPVDRPLQQGLRDVRRQDVREVEEAPLHDLVDALRRKAHRDRHGVRVDGVELHLLLRDGAAELGGELHAELLHRGPGAVHDEGAARAAPLHHVVLAEEGGVVAGHVVGPRHGLDLVLAADGLGAEAQVRHRRGARLLGGVVEVALRVHLCPLPDDGGCGLVGAHGAVRAEAEEDRLRGVLREGRDGGPRHEVRVGHVVVDADGEMRLRHLLREVVEDRLHVPGGELLAPQAVVAADDPLEDAALAQGREHVGVQGHGGGEVLLGAVQHGEGLDGLRDLGQEVLDGEGPEEAHLQDADLLAARPEVVHRLLGRLGGGPHDHDRALGLRVAVVLEELVVAPRDVRELIHRLLDDPGDGVVVPVGRHGGLVVDLRVLAQAPGDGVLRVQAALTELVQGVPRHQRLDGAVGDRLHALDGRGGPGAVEEVHEGHGRLQGGEVGDHGHVHRLLLVVRAEQRHAAGAHRHHVRVVAEDGEGLAREGAGRDVQDGGEQLAGEQVQVRDHEQQALGAGEGGAERAAGERPVEGPGGAHLGLHLAHLHRLAEDVLPPVVGVLVHGLPHARGGGDGVDERDVAHRVGDVRCTGVPVNRALRLPLGPEGGHVDGAARADLPTEGLLGLPGLRVRGRRRDRGVAPREAPDIARAAAEPYHAYHVSRSEACG